MAEVEQRKRLEMRSRTERSRWGINCVNSEVAKNDKKNYDRHGGAKEDSQQGAGVFSD